MQAANLMGTTLSLQQTRLWSQKNLIQDTSCAILLQGVLNVQIFQDALRQVIKRHEILHTVFYRIPGIEVPLQVVADSSDISCPTISLMHISASDQAAQCEAFFVALQDLHGDLEQGPLLHTQLLRLEEHMHIFLFRLSAFCSDATTLKLFVRELSLSYVAQSGGEPLEDDEPLQYADVSVWQDELLQEADAESQRTYWRAIDLSLLAVRHFPFEQGELTLSEKSLLKNGQRFVPCHLTIPLEESLQQLLQEVAQSSCVSLEALLFSCWQALLWRLSPTSPCLVGLTCDGRHYDELSSALGPYSRIVPLSVSLSHSLSFQRLLSLVEATIQEAVKRQSYFTWPISFQETDQVPTFFPLNFEFESWPAVFSAGSLDFSLLRRYCVLEPFFLKLRALQLGHALQIELLFDARYLSASLVQQLADLLPAWFLQACHSLRSRIGAWPLLPIFLQQRLLEQSAPSESDPDPVLLHQCFSAQARLIPHELAIICGSEQLTYQELNARANQLAHFLRLHGVAPNRMVAICLPRSVDQLIALLAVLKAGGTYAPLDPEYPSVRLIWQLDNLAPLFLLTHSSLRSLFSDWHGSSDSPILCLDQPPALLLQQPTHDPQVSLSPQDVAYIIYTSGSTGTPKGVMISHLAVCNYTQALCQQLAVQPRWHFGSVSTLAADLGNTSIFCSLASGGCLHLLPYETLTSAYALQNYLQGSPLDVLKIVPSHLSALLSQDEAFCLLPRKFLLLGGELLPPALLSRLAWQESSCCILNHYGPTETTIGALTNMLGEAATAAQTLRDRTVPIGRPITNMHAYILDTSQHLLPVGVVGELYLAGSGLAYGYLGRAEETAERFVPHPWSQEPGQRMYRTGDLARLREDGQIDFVGRRDNQVKLRGYRIELGEIELALQHHHNVRESVVILREDELDQPQLVAYVIAKHQPAPDSVELREFLVERLPSYMVPAVFIGLHVLPLTANGKVNRQQLPTPQEHREGERASYTAPRNPVEEILEGIWEQILKMEHIGIHDNFFSLGGHSLLATQIISRLRTTLRIELPMASLFKAPTIAGLAEYMEPLLHTQQPALVPVLVRVSREQDLPLSFAQLRLWFLNQLASDNAAYNKPASLKIRGALDIHALEFSLNEAVRRHESLRTAFQFKAGQPLQIIMPAQTLDFPLCDLSALVPSTCEIVVQEVAKREALRCFDLANGSLLRVMLLRLNKDEHVLFLTTHHITSDAWSNNILMRDITLSYNAFVKGEDAHLPDLPIQYADFALWQRQWLQDVVLEEQISYWREQLEGLTPLDLPTDHPRPAVPTLQGAREDLFLPPSLCADLRTLSQRAGVTLFMTLLAAFQTFLARYTGQSNIAVGTPIANRTHAEIEGLIGFFVNTLVLRLDLSSNPSFKELLEQVREVCLGAYAHQDLPFEKLVEVLQPERDLNGPPLFQVMFDLEQTHSSAWTLDGLTVSEQAHGGITAKFDLNLTVVDVDQGLRCTFEYNTDLFERETIKRWLEHWQILLEEIVLNPEFPVTDLPLLTGKEVRQLLLDWNPIADPGPQKGCLHHLFEQQAQQTPDTIAVVLHDIRMGYAELDRRSNQLAHYLQSRGVVPGTLVAVCMEVSIELIMALLGILKAGGAYVPLDADCPSERLAFMLLDAQPTILLSQQQLAETLPGNLTRVLCLDSERTVIEQYPTEKPLSNVAVQDLAYVIYTSGSTGLPKGVMVQHLSLVHAYEAWEKVYQLTSLCYHLQLTNVAFDVFTGNMVRALCSGGTLVLCSRETILAEERLSALLQGEYIECAEFVPAVMRYLLEYLTRTDQRLEYIKLLIVGSESWTVREYEQIRQRCTSETHIVNSFGVTEATIDSTYFGEIPPDDQERSMPIGKPFYGTTTYLLDAHLHPVPVGIPAELYIGGWGVARGYFKRPDLTAERFIPHPFTSEPGARLYRTGDRARYLPDGTLEYLGRIDTQVKLRGFRIELGEIEAILTAHPSIEESVVLAHEPRPGDKQLVAYVVSHRERAISNHELRGYLQQRVPGYMVPAIFVELEALPLMPNGKMDRLALLKLDLQNQGATFMAPRTAAEKVIAKIWANALSTQSIGIYDNFFALGGHSLLAIQVISQIHDAFQVDLPLRRMFETPTIDGLINEIAQIHSGREVVEEIAQIFREIEQLTSEEVKEQLHT